MENGDGALESPEKVSVAENVEAREGTNGRGRGMSEENRLGKI